MACAGGRGRRRAHLPPRVERLVARRAPGATTISCSISSALMTPSWASGSPRRRPGPSRWAQEFEIAVDIPLRSGLIVSASAGLLSASSEGNAFAVEWGTETEEFLRDDRVRAVVAAARPDLCHSPVRTTRACGRTRVWTAIGRLRRFRVADSYDSAGWEIRSSLGRPILMPSTWADGGACLDGSSSAGSGWS